MQPASFCGLSMGGLIGQWLLLNAPQRLDKVVLCKTAMKIASRKSGTRVLKWSCVMARLGC
ncbi:MULTISPECIES: hypothetical protein [unclassified Pseudomonas]|uniref:hypothetical protein n=1 Tax=unclassified Pseudomonas TaxID=196821 RepID=UPI002114C5C2|nr:MULTISPECIES: hypothetical protein [unclassified Pseudomonas]